MAKNLTGLTDRVVIVTGGGRGLGREMALALATAGAKVVITGAQAIDELQQTANDASDLLGYVKYIQANVQNAQACESVIEYTLGEFDAIHCLVNNAGRGMRLISETFTTEPTKFWETDPATWQTIVDINLNGAFNMARAITPLLINQGFGKIINISTSAQTMVRRGYAPYGPSKAALEAASRVWAGDLEGTGVDVNVLLPGGATDTALLPDMPVKRGADGLLLSPDIMRNPICWLCADQSNGHSGERYIARAWDSTAQDPAAGARQASALVPEIM